MGLNRSPIILGMAAVMLSGHDCLAQGLDAKPAAPALSVTIAVPMDTNGDRSIPLHSSDPYFDVVISNTSNRLQKVWAEDCSFGYDNLTLEVLAVDGKALPKSIIVSRPGSVAWSANFIRGVVLAPGDTIVREDRPSEYGAEAKRTADGYRFDYQNFPNARMVRMRAVFRSGDNDLFKGQGIWTGTVASDTGNYQIVDVSP